MSEKMTVKEAVEVMAELVDLRGGVRHRRAFCIVLSALVASRVNPFEIGLEPIKALLRSAGIDVEEG